MTEADADRRFRSDDRADHHPVPMGSAFTGLTFYSMSWVGQHILRTLRTEVFEHLHNLQLSYYADHETGDLMSRITNDTDTIQQVVSFALVSVASGILLLVWIAYQHALPERAVCPAEHGGDAADGDRNSVVFRAGTQSFQAHADGNWKCKCRITRGHFIGA